MGLTDTVTSRTGVRASTLIGTAFITTFTYVVLRSLRQQTTKDFDPDSLFSESPILKDGSYVKSFTTPIATYPSIRTFYQPHKHREQLQAIAELPLLVFIHGLGGSLEQFSRLLGSLTNVGPCFGIELPGHGNSSFDPQNYAAFTTDAFAALWKTAIGDACQQHGHSKVVLIGHSMGCSVSALLATDLSPNFDVVGMVAICPKASPPSKSEGSTFRRLLSLPDFMLNTLRYFDKVGGITSKSVKRFVGESTDLGLRRAQLHFNEQFKTPVWKRAGSGCIATYDADDKPQGGLPGRRVWGRIETPLFLIAGEADTVTKPGEVEDIVSYLQSRKTSAEANGNAHPPIKSALPTTAETPDLSSEEPPQPNPSSSDKSFGTLPALAEKRSHHSVVIKTAILPSPASHALIYDPATYRTVAGLIEDFLAAHVSPHLSLGWHGVEHRLLHRPSRREDQHARSHRRRRGARAAHAGCGDEISG